ncbi:MAG TPA: carboxypeptidase-like regulatory domain-containing protein [Solirubrobacterales bacterium]|nr:carboxypeptidase-like regulatory domain-containing protein [Solirubrobacterales bacterium]
MTAEAAGHAPVEGARVCAFSIEEEEEEIEFEAVIGDNCEVTDSGGGYTISGLSAGEYVVEFWPGYGGRNFASEYYNNKQGFFTADPVDVASGPVIEVDAEVAAGGTIHGRVVSEAGGAPIPGLWACAEGEVSPFYIECGKTDSEGEYTLLGLPAGEYWLEFIPQGLNFQYQFEREVPVSVGAVTQRNVALTPAGTITGVVTDAVSHVGLEEIFVCVKQVGGEEESRCEVTGAGGGYSIGGLPAGTYKVGFAPFAEEETGIEAEYVTQYFFNKRTLAAADPVSVVAGGTHPGVDAALVKIGAPVVRPSVPSPTVAPALVLPLSKPVSCRKGFRKKKAAGKSHCVKIRKKHRHKRHHATHREMRMTTTQVIRHSATS